MSSLKPEDIDAVLPQTQCGLCGYGGCMPYATAIVNEDAPLNLCPPGGVPTLELLGNLTKKNISAYRNELAANTKPPSLAFIREDECIGCTKCIQACPVDAILGGPKLMHTIISTECSGCDLCIPACPVDCIDIISIKQPLTSPDQLRLRNLAKNERISQDKKCATNSSIEERKNYIIAALNRKKDKQ